MKTLIRISKILFALPLLLALAACGKSSTSSSTTSSGYYLSNGACYSSSSGTMVATTYCTSSMGYYLSNGYCYNTSGTMVATTYCTATTGTIATTTASAGTCYGMYYYTNGYATQIVQCNGVNCRGYTLYEYYSKQPVLCQ